MGAIYEDVALMQSHIYNGQEETVKRWAPVECEDYQLPLALIVGFLSNAVPPISRPDLRLQNRPEYQAIVAIVRNSNLCSLLEYDASAQVVRYRETVPDSTKEEVAEFISARAIVIAE